MITCWTCEVISEIEAALEVEPFVSAALGDDDLSHVPTFGTLVDPIAERA